MQAVGRFVLVLAPLTALLVTRAVRAQVTDEGTKPTPTPGSSREPKTQPWSGSLGLGTDFPLDLRARVLARSPAGLRGSVSVGYMPQAYVSVINDVVVQAGGYDQSVAALISASLESSLLVRSHVGWSPLRDWGPYAEVGYGYFALGGSATTGDVIAQIIDRPLPPAEAAAVPASFTVDAALHQLDIEVGWDFPVSKRLEFNAAIGAALTFAANAEIEPESPVAPVVPVEPFVELGETYLERTFTTYAHTPVASMSLGYRF
jgi:hypothetical protein